MTADKSTISDLKFKKQKNHLSHEQQVTETVSMEIPEEGRKILDRINKRPELEIMKSEALRLVRIIWPSVFNVSDPHPLKIGIHHDMKAANVLPPHVIPISLRFFTSMERYLEKIKPGATRIDLNGQATGRVKLREAVDAEIKLYTRSSDFIPTRDLFILNKIRVIAIKKSASKDA